MRNVLLFLLLIPMILEAQDSTSVKPKSKLSGQWRTYYMTTFNKDDLKDFEALATGGKLKYQYYPINTLEIGVAVYNATNLGLQDLSIPDESTGRLSRYEEGLFDRLDIENDAIFLLGELYAKYKIPKHTFTVGRLKINTPLVNPEDGRMIPTLAQGFWYTHTTKNLNIFQFGLINKIAPRSTAKFYGIGESIGTYPVGRNRSGTASLYAGNTKSDYIIFTNAEVQLTQKLRLGIWNQFTQNISNSLYLKPKLKLTSTLTIEGEWLHQNKIGTGGNRIDSLRYYNQNSADVVGLKMAYTYHCTIISLAYNRIVAHGQFLSPREWGREDLFSFQKRERSEGTADNHALVLKYRNELEVTKEKLRVTTILSVGRHWKPKVTDAILNKYAVPDYTHINLDVFFTIKKLKRLKPELLISSKLGNGAIPNNPNFYFNKVDLLHVDLIFNYNF
ncbi:OprD family outer membrane porin [Maribacter sp. ACAM166]|uniref:OprD family outer membrane porin n=1 Tax=Maribacter sp. ACAM166 TaxID=2508996 RepID=UPI0010FE11CC|nr:OprD family outer membrane porin [Maribacter sp. ACAM166]TLP71895.1 OprD family porin [Maribacter sp. ACAM166]